MLQINIHHSEMEIQELDADIQIISEMKQDRRTNVVSIAGHPKKITKKRTKRIPEKSNLSVRKISDFFKKQ